jgi:hypothetical protein
MIKGILDKKITFAVTEQERRQIDKLRKEYSAPMGRFVREEILLPYLARQEEP